MSRTTELDITSRQDRLFAKNIHMQQWWWLHMNPTKNKSAVPLGLYSLLQKCNNKCVFCAITDVLCHKCPLVQAGVRRCCEIISPFQLWLDAVVKGGIEKSKKNSLIIYNVGKEWDIDKI